MEETALFGWPVPQGKDKPAGPEQMKALAVAIEESIKLLQLLTGSKGKPVVPAEGQLLIVDGTGHAAYKTMSADATINSAGVFTIGNEKVTTAKIAALAVTAAKLASEAVETGNIKGLAVSTAKIAELSVTAAKLAAEAVETGKIKERAVTSAKIALLAITTELIAEKAVTEAKLGDAAVTSRKFKPTIGRKTVASMPEGEPNESPNYKSFTLTGGDLILTPAVPSFLILWGTVLWNVHTADTAVCRFLLDGVGQSVNEFFSTFNEQTYGHMPINDVLTLTAAEHTIKLQYARKVGAGTCKPFIANNTGGFDSSFLYMLVAQ